MIQATAKQILIWGAPLLVGLASIRFVLLPPEIAFLHMAHQISQTPLLFLIHIYVAPVALILVPVQLWPGLRTRQPWLHRVLGRVAVLAMLVGGLSGLLIAPAAQGGLSGQLGFGLLGVVWMGTAGLGLWHIRAGNVAAHRRWMLRAAALAWAGVMLRLYLPVLMPTVGVHLTFATTAWLCWLRRRAQPGALQRALG